MSRRASITGYVATTGAVASIFAFVSASIWQVPVWVYATAYCVFALSLTAMTFYEAARRRAAEVNTAAILEEMRRTKEAMRQLADMRERIPEVVQVMHDVFHEIRNGFVALTDARSLDVLSERAHNTMGNILTKIASIIERMTGSGCSACVKLFLDEEGPGEFNPLATFARDTVNRERRYDNDGIRKYQVEKNTDFNLIAHCGRKWFYSADLTREPHYQNERENWSDFYRCTLVAPIQHPRRTEKNEPYGSIPGFICIDSLKVAAFPEFPTAYFLACFADSLYILFSLHREREKEMREWENAPSKTR